MFNPSAELAAFLVYWSSPQSEANQLGWQIIKKAVNRLMEVEEMDVHEVRNFQQLCNIVKGDKDRFLDEVGVPLEGVQNKVLLLAENHIEKDPTKWSGYVTLPLDIIDRPHHPLYEKMEDLVSENISFYLEQLTEDGIWEPSWSWGSHPEQYPVVKQYTQGILALMRYKILRNFQVLS